jgi:hypothetical protein
MTDPIISPLATSFRLSPSLFSAFDADVRIIWVNIRIDVKVRFKIAVVRMQDCYYSSLFFVCSSVFYSASSIEVDEFNAAQVVADVIASGLVVCEVYLLGVLHFLRIKAGHGKLSRKFMHFVTQRRNFFVAIKRFYKVSKFWTVCFLNLLSN